MKFFNGIILGRDTLFVKIYQIKVKSNMKNTFMHLYMKTKREFGWGGNKD